MSTVTTKEKEQVLELVERLKPSQVERAICYLQSLTREAAAVDAPQKRHRQDESEWMATHQDVLNAHRGEWVVIEGSRLVAADPDCLTARNIALKEGIKIPFIYRVPEDDLPFAGAGV
jgi:hypothetical protein